MTAFQESSSTSYNIGRGDNKNRKNIILSGSRKCHHNVRKRTKSGNSADDDTIAPTRSDGKHTNCPARINFKLKSTEEHVHDENCSLFPLELSISFLHNHSIESANAVKYHDVSDETKNKFIELFEAAHSASSAYQEYKNDLMKKHGEQYVTVSANRAIMPDYKWVFDMLTRRVHKLLPQAGDIVYVYASSNLDRQDSKLIKFMTCSPFGGFIINYIIRCKG